MPSKRTRRSDGDRGRTPEAVHSEPDLASIVSQFSETVFRKLESRSANKWPKEYERYLACPFRRRTPARYANVLDCACTGHGFKDIADLRSDLWDHVKRVHSYRYGCFSCKERYQCRDNGLAAHEKKHRESCKRASKGPVEVSELKPEWMTPEEDARYFKLDFRKLVGLTVEAQYSRICEAIWPGLDSQRINIWSKPGDTVSKCHLAEVLQDPDIYAPFLASLSMIASGNRSGQHQVFDLYGSEAAQPMMFNDGLDGNGVGGYDGSLLVPPTWAQFSVAEDESLQTSEQYHRLQQLTQIPKPTVYSDTGHKDSAYYSYNSEEADRAATFGEPAAGFEGWQPQAADYDYPQFAGQGDLYFDSDLSMNDFAVSL